MSATLPHRMLGGVLWLQALRYAQALVPGDGILLSIDGHTIGPFVHLLDAALKRHGLYRDPQGEGDWTIRRLEATA